LECRGVVSGDGLLVGGFAVLLLQRCNVIERQLLNVHLATTNTPRAVGHEDLKAQVKARAVVFDVVEDERSMTHQFLCALCGQRLPRPILEQLPDGVAPAPLVLA
jgi:hypothetical protein